MVVPGAARNALTVAGRGTTDLPPSVSVTVAFFQLLPLTSTPCLRRAATAAFARSERYAAAVAGFLITLNLNAMFAVVSERGRVHHADAELRSARRAR